MTVEVRNNGEMQRFEAWVDGALAGFVRYRRRPDAIALIHTETDPAYRGQGIAAELAAGALAQIRAAGEKIIVVCPYIASYLEKHPQEKDLVLAGSEATE